MKKLVLIIMISVAFIGCDGIIAFSKEEKACSDEANAFLKFHNELQHSAEATLSISRNFANGYIHSFLESSSKCQNSIIFSTQLNSISKSSFFKDMQKISNLGQETNNLVVSSKDK